MKKLILSIAIGILSIYSASAQIKIIEDTSTEIGYMKLPGMDKNMTLTLDNGTYTMMYQDVQYQHITDHKYFTFNGKETLDGLYDIMTKQFKAVFAATICDRACICDQCSHWLGGHPVSVVFAG